MHLHARWSITAFIKCCEKEGIDIGSITDYESFFNWLTKDCETSDNAYISWGCTPDKISACEEIAGNWVLLKETIYKKEDRKERVKFTKFVKIPFITKKGKEIMRLQPETSDASIDTLIEFIDELLYKIIHHRNQLKNYRSVIHKFKELFDSVNLDVDFSEKLKVPLKYEPQSMHK